MNQILLVPVAILSSILLLSAPVAVDSAGTCIDNTNSTTCCDVSQSQSCGWFVCKGAGDNTNVTICLDTTNKTAIDTECSGSTADKTSKCPVAPPTPATCQDLNLTSCCDGGDDKLTCGRYKCGTELSCWNSSDTAGFETDCENKGNKTDLVNTCQIPTDSCSPLTENSTCCNTTGCGWYQCKSADATLIGEAKCVVNTTSPPITCIDPATPLDTCAVTPTPTPAPIGKCDSQKAQETCCNSTISGSTCKWMNCTGAFVCMESSASTDTCFVKDDLCSTTTPSPITTQAPTTAAPTTAAPTTQAPAPSSNTGMQHFDGASFVGGIILAVGVIAIAFFGCKFYKARKERNYHTL